jgi:branched-chain amino acid transport system permease protein
MMLRHRVSPGILAFIAAGLLFGVFVSSPYALNVASLACIFVVLAASFNVVYGYTGLISLAHVGFFGIGAYAAALLAVDTGFSPWAAFAAGGIIAAVAAAAVGLATLRLNEDAFAIVTLTLSLLLALVAGDWEQLTRGRLGIPGLPIPMLNIGSLHADFSYVADYYYLALAFAAVSLIVLYRLVRSRIGRTLIAIRENESLARSQGVDVLRYRLLAFVVGAFFAGVAGGIHVFHLSIVDPSIFDFYFMQAILIMVIIGGPGTFWPVVVAAIVFAALPEALRAAAELRLVVYGTLLIVVMLFIPEGIGGRLKRRFAHGPRWDQAA